MIQLAITNVAALALVAWVCYMSSRDTKRMLQHVEFMTKDQTIPEDRAAPPVKVSYVDERREAVLDGEVRYEDADS